MQCSAVCCSVLQCAATCCNVVQRVAACCSVLRCIVVCCRSVLHCVTVYGPALRWWHVNCGAFVFGMVLKSDMIQSLVTRLIRMRLVVVVVDRH